MHPSTLTVGRQHGIQALKASGSWQLLVAEAREYFGMSREEGSIWRTSRAGSKAEIAKALWAKGGDPGLEWQRKVDGAWVAEGFGEQWSVIDPKGESVECLRSLLDYGRQIWREAGWIWPWERYIEWGARGPEPGWSGKGPVPSTGKYKRKGRFGKSLWPGASLPLAAKALSEASLLLDCSDGPPQPWARKAALALERLAQKQLDAAVRDWDFDGYRWPESRCWKDQRKTRKQSRSSPKKRGGEGCDLNDVLMA